jgi:peptidoglycan/xylan/chitin deacetylase (PgdA/CDA1 family)
VAASIPILMFHTLEDRRAPISFPPGVFRRGLDGLQAHGYRTLSLPEVVDGLRRGDFPEQAVAITFDDGYRTVYEEAFPALQERGLSATIFLTAARGDTGRLADRPAPMLGREMLSRREMQEMHRAGIHFGAHTVTHPDLTRLPAEQVEGEMRDSKASIEDALGAAVTCFAYPFGCHDPRSRALAREHFDCACTTRLHLVTTSSDPYTLERVDACYLRAEALFGLITSRTFAGYLAAVNVPRRLRRAWGRRP